MKTFESQFPFDEDYVFRWIEIEKKILEDNSAAFHNLAGIPQPKRVGAFIESAHQPLFAPPDWFFNKFRVAQKLADENSMTFTFGFADNDYFLFNRMWRGENKALSWNWYKRQPHHVSFSKIALPDELKDEYPKVKTLAEYNAVAIARRAEALGFKPFYITYSTLPNLNRQIDWFVERADCFRDAFNASLKARADNVEVRKIKPMLKGELPLWRVFEDGRKETVLESDLTGKIEFKAVARGFAMSSFLKSWAYVGGRGEASSYGVVADDIARALKVELPLKVVA
jgi:hypothetical protein